MFDTPFIFVYSSAMASGLLTDQAEHDGKITVGGEFGAGETTSPRGTRHVYEGVKTSYGTTVIWPSQWSGSTRRV